MLYLEDIMNNLVIKNSHLTLSVAPDIGASVRSFTYERQGTTYNVFRNSGQANTVNDMSCFALAPFASRVQHGKFEWNGHDVQLAANFPPEPHALHGFAWQRPWQVKSQSETAIDLRLEHVSDDWPWSFVVELRYELIDLCLNMTLTTTNLSDTEMPSGLGLHPFFDIDDNTKVKVDAQQMWQMNEQVLPIGFTQSPAALLTELGANANELVVDNVLINDSDRHEIVWHDRGFKADLRSSGCPYTVLYRPEDGPFFCIEPISHCANALTMAREEALRYGVKPLASGECHTISQSIILSDLVTN